MATVARNLDEVLAQLSSIVAASKAKRDRVGLFAALYRQVTLEVKRSIDAGRFNDGPRMDRFDTAFANRYFAALDAWRTENPTPKCWRSAFELLPNDDSIFLQHLLLGVNAHINFDLAIAAAASAAATGVGAGVASATGIDALAHDYNLINDILFDVLNKVQTALDDVSPFMHLLDDLGGRSDEQALDFSLRAARGQAWQYARILSCSTQDQTGPIVLAMDLSATALARLIARPAGILQPALQIIRHGEARRDLALVIDRLDHALSNRV